MKEWHVITPEYPPQRGGVADYTQLLATALVAAGESVHVWYPARAQTDANSVVRRDGVVVHSDLGKLGIGDVCRTEKELSRFGRQRRFIAQWVPHGYGFRSMNVLFCGWLLLRRLRGEQIELIVHEPFLPFKWNCLRQNIAACIHRLMTVMVLAAASEVYVCMESSRKWLRPYAFGRHLKFEWLPVPSNIVPVQDDFRILDARRRYLESGGELLVGHFGTYGRDTSRMLEDALPQLLCATSGVRVLLIGSGSINFRRGFVSKFPHLSAFIHATGELSPSDVSICLSACDLILQPYPDGVSTRRGTMMAALAHGCAVVTTRGHNTDPSWDHSAVAVLADAADIRGLVSSATDLLNNVSARRSLGARAQEYYLKHFHIGNTVTALRKERSYRVAVELTA